MVNGRPIRHRHGPHRAGDRPHRGQVWRRYL